MSPLTVTFAITCVLQGTLKDIELRKTMEFPFVPRAGDTIATCDEEDMLVVDTIYWNPSEGTVVFFESMEISPDGLKERQANGWKITEGGE